MKNSNNFNKRWWCDEIMYLTRCCHRRWSCFSRSNISTFPCSYCGTLTFLHCTYSLQSKWNFCFPHFYLCLFSFDFNIKHVFICSTKQKAKWKKKENETFNGLNDYFTIGNTFGTRFIWYWYWTSRTLTTTNSPRAANTKIMQPAIHKSNACDRRRTQRRKGWKG